MVFGKNVDQQASFQEQQDMETAQKLEKAAVQGDDSSFTFWVASVPQQPETLDGADQP